MSDDRELVEAVALAMAKEIGWGTFSHFDPNDMRRVARAAIEAIGNTRITPGSDLRDALEEARDEFLAIKECADDDEAFLCWQAANRGIEAINAALTKDDHGGGQTEEDRANPASQDRAGAPSGLSPSVSSKAAHRISREQSE